MKKYYTLLALLACLSIGSTAALGQGLIRGSVTSAADGQPLIGANVLIKGTAIGTITDLDGSFSIEVGSADNILVVSYTGFLTQEVNVGTQSFLNIALE